MLAAVAWAWACESSTAPSVAVLPPDPPPDSTAAPPDSTAARADRETLVAFYRATGGPGWTAGGNWLTDAPTGDWHGVETDAFGRVERLSLGRNGLTGPIPPELGNLASLEELYLEANGLTGPIPPELGNLAALDWLRLEENGLTGPIPPELGNLASLVGLFLANNVGLVGPLPASLVGLRQLEALTTWGTALCAPPDPGFQTWFRALQVFDTIPLCDPGAAP